MVKTFFGGVHPKSHKARTRDLPVVNAPVPAELIIPMSMHIGAPGQSLVSKGDYVKVGQKIGEAPGLNSPVHASVSGTVVAVEPRQHQIGTKVMSVVIENDYTDTVCDSVTKRLTCDELSAEELIELIHNAGIAGMGGACFPTHVKISSGLGKVDTLIINGCECEPYITSDDRLMREQPEQILGGLRILMRIFGVKTAHVAVESDKPQALSTLRDKAGDDIVIHSLKVRYPQGAEKQLVQAVSGREIPPGQLPASVGCAVFNVATAAAVFKAVYEGMPLIERLVTITGRAIAKPGNFLARIGTPLEALIEAAGGFVQPPHKVICGGPMMGVAQFDLSVPLMKGTNAILCLGKEDDRQSKDPVCIRCGRCIEVCPMLLMPLYMYMYERKDRLEELERLKVSDCIECGACTYICPGRLPLTQSFRSGKQRIKSSQSKV